MNATQLAKTTNGKAVKAIYNAAVAARFLPQ
jgi:hypothetical protein